MHLLEIDELVWRHCSLMEDPTLVQAEIDRQLETMRATHPATRRRDALERDLTRAQTALRRLLDGYQEQLVTLAELHTHTRELRKREATLQAQLDALDAELHDAETYLNAHRDPRRVPRPPVGQRREPDRRAAPADHPARRPRGPDR